MKDFKQRSVATHQFAMIPRADIPRSSFRMQRAYKTTFDAGWLIPVLCEEVLPGDSFNLKMTAFARLATPIVPVMDNMYLDSFFFFVPNRLVWTNWIRFMGEQTQPGDSISYAIPQIVSPASGYTINSLYDYLGLPTLGQVHTGSTVTHSALPLRAYAMIYNQWFRDENLNTSISAPNGDGPDTYTVYGLVRRGKRHDYFTSALPWTQKGNPISLPLGSTAPVIAASSLSGPVFAYTPGTGTSYVNANTGGAVAMATPPSVNSTLIWATSPGATGLVADLSTATAATINQLRQAFQIQKLLERDARGGTRYTEIVRSHFGVQSPDARLQRPEYLGGGTTPVSINAVAQSSATTASGTDTPQGNLAAFGTALAHNQGFTYSSTEHGYFIGIVSVRADLTYQQGLRRHWSRLTRYDYYFPAFAMLGEQAILNKEIFCDGQAADDAVFGYQERWAEYRYSPSEITGLFRSTASGTLDVWHLAQKFSAVPTLNSTFINDTPPVDRIVAVGDDANGQQFLFDAFFDIKAARPLPMYSVPGLIDHF